MSKDNVWGEIKVSLGPSGIWFEGRLEPDATEQARDAYLEVAEVVAKYVTPGENPYHFLTKIRGDVYQRTQKAP